MKREKAKMMVVKSYRGRRRRVCDEIQWLDVIMFPHSFSSVGKVTKDGLGFLNFDFELDWSGIDQIGVELIRLEWN